MLRKFVSLMLVLSMVLSLSAFTAAADDTASSALDELKALGILRGYESYEAKTFSVMPKAAFVTFLMNMTEDEKYSGSYDVNALERAEQLGIINSASSVSESDTLKTDEAVKMVMCLLGYKEYCEHSGGYPSGYLTRAQNVGLTKGLKLSGEVKNGEAYELLLKAIDTDIAEAVRFGEEDGETVIEYEKTDGRTILNLYRHIYTVEGVVTANKTSGLFDSKAAPVGKATVEDTDIIDPTDMLYDYLGYKVKAYAKRDSNGNYTAIWAKLHEDTETVEFMSSDIKSISDDLRTFEYYTDESSSKTKKETIAASATLLLNGALCTSYTESDFKSANAKITIIKNGVSKADVVKLDVYDTMLVSAVSPSSNVINSEFKFNGALSKLDLDNYNYKGDYIKITRDGEDISLADIKQGDVLSVLVSTTGENKSVRIYVTGTAETVAVDSVNQKSDEVSADGAVYTLSDFYKTANAKSSAYAETIVPGTSYVFYFDINGEVVGAKAEGSILKYAYLRAVGTERASGLTSDTQLRVFTTDGEWQTLTLNDRISLNGSSVKTNDALSTVNGAVNGLIGYTLNKFGEISRLETPQNYYEGISSERLNTVGAGSHAFRYNTTSFDCYHYMTGDTKVIMVPSDDSQLSDEALYDVGNNYSFTSNTTYSYVGYGADEYNFLDFAVIKKSSSDVTATKSTLYLVRDISSVSGEYGNTLQVLLSSKAYFGLSVKAKDASVLSGVSKGDIIKIHVNREGYIDNMAYAYKVSSGTVKDIPSDLNSDCCVKGVVTKVDPAGGRILLDSTREIALKVGSASVLVWDADNDELSVGTVNDAVEGDYVIADLDHTEVKGLYVYKNLNN